MKDETFTLEPAAETSLPPYAYDLTVTGSRQAFWNVREGNGRRVGRANTRAGARAAILALYLRARRASGVAPMDRETLREIDRAAREDALKPRRWTPPVAATPQLGGEAR